VTGFEGAESTVVRTSAAEAVVLFDLAPGYPGFDGHFPGNPILPGMCHLDLAVRAASLATGLRLELEAAERARFTRAVRPRDLLRVTLSWEDMGEGLLRVRTVHAVGEEGAAELLLLVRRPAGPAPG
jgi:3-hydroxyacyl-[acyl-carrier-protein] dehydratase